MTEFVLFKPRREVDAQKNLASFVALCRDELSIFGVDLPFEGLKWDVTADIPLKGMKCRIRAVFSSWATVNDRTPAPMPEPFLSFSKSYFRYQHGMRPTKAISFRIAANRALCAALEELGTSDPTATDVRALNRAALLIQSKFAPSAAYRIAQQLEILAAFMDVNRLAKLPLQWRNPIPRPAEQENRLGEEFDARREAKLPSPFELDSLARAFRAATSASDQFVTGVAAIMCSAPDRVSEVLILRADCATNTERPNQPPAYGLRFWPAKGADPMVKWVVPSMTTVVQEALARLTTISSEARAVASWYEKNPKTLFLPAHLEHLRGQDLTMPQLGDVLYTEPVPRTTPLQWCRQHGVPSRVQDGKSLVSFVDVEAAVIGLLPRSFPYLDVETGVLFSQALCVVRRNELQRRKTTLRCVIEAVDRGFIATGLGGRSKHGFKSVFENLSLFNADGTPIAIRTHQFRHYLNTLAHSGGMSELDIAKWSGRKDVRQNSAYNHVSDRDTQARLTEIRQEANGVTSTDLAPTGRINLVSREKFKEMSVHAAHTTDFGLCVHDFAMAPCALHLDCINCNEQICVKGDAIGESNLRSLHAETATLLAEAENAQSDGHYGATPWVRHQKIAFARLNELIGILDSPRVPPGAIIRLTHIQPASRFKQALEGRKALDTGDPELPQLRWTVDEEAGNE